MTVFLGLVSTKTDDEDKETLQFRMKFLCQI